MPTNFNTKTLASVEVPDKTIFYPVDQAQTINGRAEQVMSAIGLVGIAAIIAKALPPPQQAIIGRFSQSDYDSFLRNKSYGISVWPLPMSKMVENYFPTWYDDAPPAMPLTQTSFIDTTTIGGSVIAGIVIGVATGTPLRSQTFTTTADDTLTSVITTIAAICTSLGVTNSVSGASITTHAPLTLRFGLPSTQWREASRIIRHLQISVWSGVESLRSTVADALEGSIGTIATPMIDTGDGKTQAWVKYANSRRMDDDQIDSLWIYHLIVTAQYGVLDTRIVHPIVATSISVNTNGGNSLIIQS